MPKLSECIRHYEAGVKNGTIIPWTDAEAAAARERLIEKLRDLGRDEQPSPPATTPPVPSRS